MKKYIGTIITVIVVLAATVLGFVFCPPNLDSLQLETMFILACITGGSILYCFIVGEITLNNSQMDKLWSILPIAYIWVIAIKGGLSPRLLIMALLVTLWGIRLTANFARKGAYSIKFWTGEEDYRWVVLRKNKLLQPRWKWAIFDLLFISIYQNVLVLAICLPAVAVMSSTASFGVWDYVASIAMFGFILLETIADEQQMAFYKKRGEYYAQGKKLEEMPLPYSRGFNTSGLWGHSRHPNYFSEQGTWISLYIFTIGAGVIVYGVFNWSMVGCLFLVLLFLGSSAFGEGVSSSKYPEYKLYQAKVSKYVPWLKYNPTKESAETK
ncbi:MAG: DUF1295 domain-containing protein [Bacilli bacterium]|nr:DUF1295 domain-containing protein [Bacilli bacterium]